MPRNFGKVILDSISEYGIILFDCGVASVGNTRRSSSENNEQNVDSDKHDFGDQNRDRTFD